MKLILKYPLTPFSINQNFGDSLACTENNNLPITQRKVVGKMKLAGSLDSSYVCPVGYVDLYPLLGMKGHTGADLKAYHGQELYHCGPEATVEEIQTEPERGLGLGLITTDKHEFSGGFYHAKLRYWHLQSFNVKKGDIIKQGDFIGLCDNTGLSAGDHLHLELKPVDRNSNGVWYNLLQDNGFYGSIDPIPYFNGEYANNHYAFYFTKDIRLGDDNEDVKQLQKKLRKMGYFTYPTDSGYYGEITRLAVYRFQLDHVVLGWWAKNIGRGMYCSELTRQALNGINN